MALRRADAGQKLVDAEGLRHIIVGAEIERLDLGPSVSRLERTMIGKVSPLRPQFADDFEPIHVGQAEVEHDDIGRLGPDRFERAAAIIGLGDDIALCRQARP